MLRFGSPVFNSAGEKKGVVLINYNGSALIEDFRRAMVEKRHAMLLNRERILAEQPRHQPGMGLHVRAGKPPSPGNIPKHGRGSKLPTKTAS